MEYSPLWKHNSFQRNLNTPVVHSSQVNAKYAGTLTRPMHTLWNIRRQGPLHSINVESLVSSQIGQNSSSFAAARCETPVVEFWR